MAARYVCTRCGVVLTCDRGDADGIMCGEPGCSGWASKLTSPAGRWAAMRHHPGWTPDEWAGLCAYEVPPQSDVLTGIGIVDAGGARVCPSRAVEGDTLCAFHRDRVDPPAAAETPLEQLGLFA